MLPIHTFNIRTLHRLSLLAVVVAFMIASVPRTASAQSSNRDRWKLDCIVLDPGHGGKDPGAIGTNGTREKDVVLGIAKKLGALIRKHMPGVKTVYTRDDDRFIELYRRGKIANEASGKLFISIHCNSLEKKPSTFNGFEVYLLRPGRTKEAMRIAEFENSVIQMEQDYQNRYKELDAQAFIVINMAQSAYAQHSEEFALSLIKHVKGSPHVKSRGIKQAGFYVLVGASMPAVLVETDYLSNPAQEKFLASAAGQSHMAQLIFNAIKDFAKYYDEKMNE